MGEEETSKEGIYNRIKGFLGRGNRESGVEKRRQQALSQAEWAVMKMTSAEVQTPKKSIVPNKYELNTSLREVAIDKVTIVRVEGGVRHREYQEHYWFVFVAEPDVIHSFSVSPKAEGPKERLVLKPEASGYKLLPGREFVGDDSKKEIPIEFFMNEIWGLPYDMEIASSEKIDIMFGGSPEKVKPGVVKSEELGMKNLVPERGRELTN